MKFLDISSLDSINTALVFENPECRVIGRIETYSCKLAGVDKKLYKNLEGRWNSQSQSVSPDQHSFHNIISPFGPMDQPSSRRTLFNLIATLNASYPDYDFSSDVDDIIELDECNVYSFNPDIDSDPNAEDGAIINAPLQEDEPLDSFSGSESDI
ncbi:10096_t:CDS:2, partial [Racocetra persica]